MKKNVGFLSLTMFALVGLVSCKKDQQVLKQKDEQETQFLTQES